MEIIFIVTLACLFQTSSAFLPNHLGSHPYLKDEDYTLTDVTKRGILLAVADYFQNNPPDGKTLPRLPDLVPLTPSKLYDAYYGDGVSAAKFERAIEQIISSNMEVSRLQSEVAKWHFNGEQIFQGNQLMIRMRDAILSILEMPTPNYDSARDYVGEYLHLLQCFYANTDWIELWHFKNRYDPDPHAPIYEDLGRRDKPFFPVAPDDIPTCRNCLSHNDCSFNIWDVRRGEYLTSGYKSGQDIKKPRISESNVEGKCSHGGPYDASRDIVATGGINKDGSDSHLAPHFYHHVEAAELAIQATREFLHSSDYSIFKNLTSLGNERQDERFRNLFNLGTGATLAFVIDDTGSMGDEITAVKAEAIQIVRETNGTIDAPYNYVVVPFNDPGVGPLLVTEDPEECIDFISALAPHGGGDCPELCNTGLEIAVSNSLPGSQIYVFTDASEKDSHKTEAVLALVQSKECRVDYILTGDCSLLINSEKYPNAQKPSEVAYDVSRDQSSGGQRMRPSSSSAYSAIAKGSGGGVYTTDKTSIGDITEIIKVGLGSSKIHLAKWSWDGSTSSNTTYMGSIFIDSTVTEFSVVVSGESDAPDLELIKPSGEPVSSNDTNIEIVVSVDLVLAISATNPMVGEWQIWIKNPQYKYEFDITGQSIVDFIYQFLEADESGAMFPMVGTPIAGVPTTISINVIGMEHVGNAELVKLTPIAGEESLYPLEPAGGHDGNTFLAIIAPPFDPFPVAIEGRDRNDNVFVRLAPTLVSAQSFKLDFLPSDGDELNPGGSKHIPFSLYNEGINDTFTLRAETDDTRKVSVTVQPTEVFVTEGKTAIGNISLVAESAEAGTVSIVTLFAYSSSGKITSVVTSQYIAEPDQQIPDSTNPICKLDTSRNGTECTAEMMSPDTCALHLWSIIFEAQDDESGIYALDVFPEATSAEFNIDFNNGSVAIGSYSADCCCPLVTISIRDYFGNVGQCNIDYYAPVSDIAPVPTCLPQPPSPPTTLSPTTLSPTTSHLKTTKPVPILDGLSLAAIIGIAVCGTCVLIIIVGILTFVLCKKSTEAKREMNKQKYDERKFSDLVYDNTGSPIYSTTIN